ncbi:MAG: MoaD/ThiS family protein [Pyrinomonadaceae bacterium]|nr:MoaD/ThiS family protein [Pyrinomonadaceae bacterium]
MKVKVLFFGATADSVGEREVRLELPDGTFADKALEEILDKCEGLRENHDVGQLHFSINQEYSNGKETICDGDELAVFTAVSGG